MKCEKICISYKRLGLTACEGCSGKENRKPMKFKEDFLWLRRLKIRTLK